MTFMQTVSFTLEDIGELIDQKLDQKLQPIKDELAILVSLIKIVMEREFKHVHTRLTVIENKVDLLDRQLSTVIEDYEPRFKRIEDFVELEAA